MSEVEVAEKTNKSLTEKSLKISTLSSTGEHDKMDGFVSLLLFYILQIAADCC